MKIDIKKFEKEDLNKGLLELLQENWVVKEITEETLDKFLAGDNYMYIAVDSESGEDVIVGCATLHLQYKLIRDGGVAGYIEEVIVKKEYRNFKIGSLIIKSLLGFAKMLGCYKVQLSCFPDRVNFYETNGFYNESITMRHNLGNGKN